MRRPCANYFFEIHRMRRRKLGSTPTAWLAFTETVRETVGRDCGVEELTDSECLAVIDALRRMPDLDTPGQQTLDI